MVILLIGLNIAKVFQKESGVRELKKLKKLERLIGNGSRLRVPKASKSAAGKLPLDPDELDQQIINEAQSDPEVVQISREVEKQKQDILDSLTDILFDRNQEKNSNAIFGASLLNQSLGKNLQKEKHTRSTTQNQVKTSQGSGEKSYSTHKLQDISPEKGIKTKNIVGQNNNSFQAYSESQQHKLGKEIVENIPNVHHFAKTIEFNENLSSDERQQLESIKQMIMESMKKPQIKKAVDNMHLLAKERLRQRRIKEIEKS